MFMGQITPPSDVTWDLTDCESSLNWIRKTLFTNFLLLRHFLRSGCRRASDDRSRKGWGSVSIRRFRSRRRSGSVTSSRVLPPILLTKHWLGVLKENRVEHWDKIFEFGRPIARPIQFFYVGAARLMPDFFARPICPGADFCPEIWAPQEPFSFKKEVKLLIEREHFISWWDKGTHGVLKPDDIRKFLLLMSHEMPFFLSGADSFLGRRL